MLDEPTPAIRPKSPPLSAMGTRLVAAAVLWLAAMAPGQVAAASNALSAGKVTPAIGTTQTSFEFSVTYTSPQGFPATRVVARAANGTVDLVLFSGRADDGVWRGTSRLPAGSWSVTFDATAAQGKNPTLAGPTVTVTDVPAATTPPTATPRATVAPVLPTPTPAVPAAAAPVTAAPQPVVPAPAASSAPGIVSPSAQTSAADATPAASARAGGGVVVGTPGGAVTPVSRTDEVADGTPWTLAMAAAAAALIALIAGVRLLGVVGRRRRTLGGPTSEVPSIPPVVVAAQAAARPLAEWELASLDDEPIGTVDYPGRA